MEMLQDAILEILDQEVNIDDIKRIINNMEKIFDKLNIPSETALCVIEGIELSKLKQGGRIIFTECNCKISKGFHMKIAKAKNELQSSYVLNFQEASLPIVSASNDCYIASQKILGLVVHVATLLSKKWSKNPHENTSHKLAEILTGDNYFFKQLKYDCVDLDEEKVVGVKRKLFPKALTPAKSRKTETSDTANTAYITSGEVVVQTLKEVGSCANKTALNECCIAHLNKFVPVKNELCRYSTEELENMLFQNKFITMSLEDEIKKRENDPTISSIRKFHYMLYSNV